MIIFSPKEFSSLPDLVRQRVEKSLGRTLRAEIEVKKFQPDGQMIIEGYANAALVDRGNELMPKECWDLANYKLNPIVCLNHDWDKGIGTCLEAEATDKGLFARVLIGDPQSGFDLTNDQIETRSRIAQKIQRTFSVGFIPRKYQWDEKTEILTYTEVELLEISVVSIPMQQNSLFTAAKAFWSLPLEQSKGFGMKTKEESETNAVSEELVKEMKANTEICQKIKSMCEKAWGGTETEPEKALKKTLGERELEISTLKKDKDELESLVKELTDALAV